MNIDKALQVLPFCGVTARENGKVTRVLVPASTRFDDNKQRQEPRFAEVTIKRNGLTLSVACHCHYHFSDGEPIRCIGMENNHVCYHALAAIIVACENTHYVTFHDTKPTTNKTVITVKTEFGNAKLFAVITPKKPQKQEPQVESCHKCKKNPLRSDKELESGYCVLCNPPTIKPLPVKKK